MARPILIAGIPRSGSSWIGRIVSRADGVSYVPEPDNEKRSPQALKAKRKLGRFPLLLPEDPAPGFERLLGPVFGQQGSGDPLTDRASRSLWAKVTERELEDAVAGEGLSLRLRAATALVSAGSTPVPVKRPVVKSVHVPLALRWIRARYDPVVVVVLRHPLNILASMLELDMPDRDRRLDRSTRVVETYVERWGCGVPPASATPLERSAWQVGLLQSALAEDAGRQDTFTVVHDDLCRDPDRGFRSLLEHLALSWSPAIESDIAASDRQGSGYKTNRIAAEQPERWRKTLAVADVDAVRAVLERFPLPGWPRDGSDP